MPYIILIIGVLIGLYALYRFFLSASVDQIKALFITAIFVVVCVAMFFLALTGRFGSAVAVLLVAAPIFWPLIKHHLRTEMPTGETSDGPMTREEALKILDVYEGATEDEIQESYKRLMLKVHPDNQGSDWMAVKLNQARDLLLK